MTRYIVALIFVSLSYAQNAFQSLEGVVGYIVVEKRGKVENYLVIEDNSIGKPSTKKYFCQGGRFLNCAFMFSMTYFPS